MRDLGYVEGRNIAFEFRNYDDDVDSIASHISDLLQAKVDIIVAGGTAAVQAAQAATQSIPIVMGAVADPMGSGLIASLARPGGNTTGLTLQSAELTTKRLELLKEVMPQAVPPAHCLRKGPYNVDTRKEKMCGAAMSSTGKRKKVTEITDDAVLPRINLLCR
jgi:ABC-type uncharacterized transport system substrate-binding protein